MDDAEAVLQLRPISRKNSKVFLYGKHHY